MWKMSECEDDSILAHRCGFVTIQRRLFLVCAHVSDIQSLWPPIAYGRRTSDTELHSLKRFRREIQPSSHESVGVFNYNDTAQQILNSHQFQTLSA